MAMKHTLNLDKTASPGSPADPPVRAGDPTQQHRASRRTLLSWMVVPTLDSVPSSQPDPALDLKPSSDSDPRPEPEPTVDVTPTSDSEPCRHQPRSVTPPHAEPALAHAEIG